MGREECLTVDWHAVGYEDGVTGYSGDRIGKHRKACAKHGVTTDLAAYQAGREEGLREYCVPANGFKLGSRGGDYAGMCPPDLDPAFADAFQSGRQLYTLESRLTNVVYEFEATRYSLRKAESDMATSSARAISSQATAEERAHALDDVKRLGERIGRLKAEITQLEVQRVNCERDLEDYRATMHRP